MSLDRPPVHISSAALGPNEVGARTFATVRRGFDPDAVRRFLEEVAVLLRQASQREAELETRLADAERRAANPKIDEATLASAVGLETARVLQAAHDAARDVVARAEAEAASLRAKAASVLDERTATATGQAEEIISRARAEAAELREAAERAASAARDTTTEQCRAMVAEAREARRRVLADLATRRRSLHLQIEQLRAGKDTLLGVVDAVASEVESLRGRLAGAEEQARGAADDVTDHPAAEGERASSEDLAGLSVLNDELVAETLLAAEQVAEQLAEQGRAGAADGESEPGEGPDVLVEEPLEPGTDVETIEDAGSSSPASAEGAGGADAHGGDTGDVALAPDPEVADAGREMATAADDLAGGARGANLASDAPGDAGIESPPRTESGQDTVEAPPPPAAPGVARGEDAQPPLGAEHGDTGDGPAGISPAAPAQTPPDDGAVAAEATTGELQATGDTGDGDLEAGGPSGKPTVDELFARIRANRAQEVAEAHRVLGSQPSEPSPAAGTVGNALPAAPWGAFPTSHTSQPASAANATATAAGDPSPKGVNGANGPTSGTREAAGRSRRRGGTSAAVAEEAEVLPAENDDGGGTGEPLSAVAAVIAQRDELLGGCPSELARRLKRALLEEQNEILDALRHRRKDDDAGAVVVDSLNAARLAEAAAALLGRCRAAGCGFAESLTEPGAQHLLDLDAEPNTTAVEIAGLLAGEISEQIAGRLTQGIDELGGDPSGIPSLVGSVYREWKGERVERVAADYANRAFSDGVGQIAGRAGLLVRWVVDDSGGGCPDCDDNELAGPIGAEDEFPTGHLRPPVHAGCRCLLVPVLA